MDWQPAILRLYNGDSLCFHREGREHGMAEYEARAVVSRSADGGRTWLPAVVIRQQKDWAISPRYPAQTPDGSVWLNLRMLKIRGDARGWKWAIMRSADDGHTWEQVSDRYGMGTGIPLSNGRLLYVNWTRSDPWNSVRSTFTSEWQNGTMQFSDERVHLELGPSGDEWSIAETFTPGELICMMRQQNHSQYYATARSFDYGRSWAPWRESNVFMGRNPCRPRVHTMPDGRLFFTYGQRDIGRTFAVVSYDKGKHGISIIGR